MKSLFTTRIFRSGSSNVIALPREILKAYKWDRGDQLVYGINSEQVLFIRKLTDKEITELKALPSSTLL